MPYFCKDISECKYLSLTWSIYKDMGYEMFVKSASVAMNNQKIRTQTYTVIKRDK
jgi:hypothetical protein